MLTRRKSIMKTFSIARIWLYLLVIVLTIGVFFRLTNLKTKVYWSDEVFTSLRISGYTEAEVTKELYTNKIFSAEELYQYQYPNSHKNFLDTLNSITVEGAQHPPLYFSGLRFWIKIFGNSIANIRAFSVLFSLLCFPVIYLLCRELFEFPKVGEVAITLFAVSPFHVLYGQAARQYSMWTFFTLLSSWAVLRALKRQTKSSWILYSLTIALSFYTFPFSIFTIIGHGIYIIFFLEKFKITKIVKTYLLSLSAAVISFFPWIIYAILSLSHVQKTTRWLSFSFKHGTPQLVFSWLRNITRLFIDFEDKLSLVSIPFLPYISFPYIIVTVIIITFIGYAIYFTYQKTPRFVWLFILISIAVAFLPLALPDLIIGGKRSGIARYLIPAYLSIQISVAYFLAVKIFSPNKLQTLGKTILALIISLGILSCFYSSSQRIWWNNGPSKVGYIPTVAEIINQAENPLVISNLDWNPNLTLIHQVKPSVKFMFRKNLELDSLPDRFANIFLYSSLDREKSEQAQQKYGVEVQPAYSSKKVMLWTLKKSEFDRERLGT